MGFVSGSTRRRHSAALVTFADYSMSFPGTQMTLLNNGNYKVLFVCRSLPTIVIKILILQRELQ